MVGIKLELNHQSLNYQIKRGDLILLSFGILEKKRGGEFDYYSSSYNLSRGVVERAIDYMQKRHPLLRSRLQHDTSTGTSWLHLDEESQLVEKQIPIDWDTCESRASMIKCFESKLNKPFGFDTLTYLWRVFVAEFVEDYQNDETQSGKNTKYAVAIWLPMLITDGINGVALNIELVNIINALLVNKECVEMRERLEHLGDVYNLAEERHVLSDTIRKNMAKYKEASVVEEIAPPPPPPPPCLLPPEFKSHTAESGTRLTLIRLDREKTARLLNISKQRGHRLTGVLAAVYLYSLRQLYDENHHKFDEMEFCMPLSLRFRYEPQLSMSHTGYNILLPSIRLKNYVYDEKNMPETIWINAEMINGRVDQALNFERADSFVSLFDAEAKREYNQLLHEAFDKKSERAAQRLYETRAGDFAFSNIGKHVADRVKEFDQGPFKIVEHYFGDSLSSTPTLLASCIAYVEYWNEQLFTLVSTNSYTMSERHARRLGLLYETNLVQLSTTTSQD